LRVILSLSRLKHPKSKWTSIRQSLIKSEFRLKLRLDQAANNLSATPRLNACQKSETAELERAVPTRGPCSSRRRTSLSSFAVESDAARSPLRKPDAGCRLPVPFTDRHGRIAADRFPFPDVADDPALAGDTCARADVEMVADADLSADHDAVADDGAACDTDLAKNNAMPSKPDIVRDVHEVIENSPRANDGVTGRTSVYRAVRTNLDIVFDNDTAKLGNAQSPIPRGHEAETLSANADTGRDPDSGAMMAQLMQLFAPIAQSSPSTTPLPMTA
jgi:hypothetical protein